MKSMTVKAALIAALVAAALASSAAASNAPLNVTFDKHVVDPTAFVFQGTTGGDVPGALTSKLVSIEASTGPILHLTFDWIVSAGAKSFTARTWGKLEHENRQRRDERDGDRRLPARRAGPRAGPPSTPQRFIRRLATANAGYRGLVDRGPSSCNSDRTGPAELEEAAGWVRAAAAELTRERTHRHLTRCRPSARVSSSLPAVGRWLWCVVAAARRCATPR